MKHQGCLGIIPGVVWLGLSVRWVYMDKYLERRLKSEDRNVRYTAIDELAELSTEEAVGALTKIANGETISKSERYDQGDQEHAMDCLLRAGTDVDLDFLEHFFLEGVSSIASEYLDTFDDRARAWYATEHTFPNARGEIGKNLHYRVDDDLADTRVPDYVEMPWNPVAHRIRDRILKEVKQRRESVLMRK